MNVLIKCINKFNGNLCFVGDTATSIYIFECDRQSGELYYTISSRSIKDVCLNDVNSYLVAFGTNWLGKFENGVLDETYFDTGLDRVDAIIKTTNNEYYALNRVENQLSKFVIV